MSLIHVGATCPLMQGHHNIHLFVPLTLFFSRFRLPGLLAITGVLAGISFITTAVLYAHFDLDAVSLGKQ